MAIKRAVVLTSGGLDSSTCLAVARDEGFEIYALSFDYGQRHKLELEAAAQQAKLFDAKKHVTAHVDMRVFGGSALTDEIDVPKAQAGTPVEEGIPITYVPARNTIFLSYALGWAEVLGASDIFIGVNAVDYSGYPDCRPEFIEAFTKTANLATKAGVEGKTPLTVHTPLLDLTKAGIVELGTKLGVDFSATWSCYDPTPQATPCGQCDSCRLRAKGFEEAKVSDPLLAKL